MRFLPTSLHGAIDYLVGVVLLTLPYWWGFADVPAARLTTQAFGVAAIVYALLTRYELGVIRMIPVPVHLVFDALFGILLLASPFVLGFSDRVYGPHLVFGIFAIVASLITRTAPSRLRSEPRLSA